MNTSRALRLVTVAALGMTVPALLALGIWVFDWPAWQTAVVVVAANLVGYAEGPFRARREQWAGSA